MAAELPDHLSVDRHRSLEGRRKAVILRRLAVAGLGAVLLAGLIGAFGQGVSTVVARGSSGTLAVSAPERVRGGLLFQARFEVVALAPLAKPTIVLEDGWLEGSTMNTLTPSPTRETSRAGSLELEFEPMRPGEILTIFADFQVNPAGFGRRAQRVELRDRGRVIATVPRSMTIFP